MTSDFRHPEDAGHTVDLRDGRRLLVIDLDGTPGSVRDARGAVDGFLAESAANGASVHADTASDILLVVAELVANACRHAPGPCRVTVTLDRDTADIAVRDSGQGRLRLIPHETPAGYGLLIVARLTSGIHVLPVGGGKIVRATVPLLGPRPTLV
ncbi:MAG: ATP-binding protein [Streptomycetaceae bacterium]|nr:ATP-binding protein [Streptomycetaceae bacterium]